MRRYLKKFSLVLLFAHVAIGNSQGVLIIELSDTINTPLVETSVTIKGKSNVTGNDTIFSYKTDKNGRCVDGNFPIGDYSYVVDYGDYNTGSFSVTDGDYTWIDLDFRRVTVSSYESDGKTPRVGKKIYISVVNDNDATKVSEKLTGKDGSVEFIVPKGVYRYTAGSVNSPFFEVNDKNINMSAVARSGLVTHKTYFHFISAVDSVTPIEVYTKNFRVISSTNKGGGEVPASGSKMSGEYFLVTESNDPISLNEDEEYTYEINTKDYGLIGGKCKITEDQDINYSIVYVYIDETKKNSGGSGSGDDNNNKKITPQEEYCLYKAVKVAVKVLSSIDSITPLNNIPVYNKWQTPECYGQSGSWQWTSEDGMTYFAPADSLNFFFVGNDVFQEILPHDTLLTYYINPNDVFAKGFFRFFYGDEQFNPESVKYIETYHSSIGYLNILPQLNIENGETTYVYNDPVSLIKGSYYYEFKISEKNYDGRLSKIVEVAKTDTTYYFDIKLEKSYFVDIYFRDYDENVAPNVYVNMKNSDGSNFVYLADSTGHFRGRYFGGNYEFSAFGDTIRLDSLQNDTTIYFSMKGESQNTRFQFLHDGKPVYPEITHLDIYKQPENELYARSISTIHLDTTVEGKSWIFEDSVKLEINDYTLSYNLDDYELKGSFTYDFRINGGGDTLIYIVIPVKRNVKINVLDANGQNICNVYGSIYKYNDDGELVLDTQYDSGSHYLKSNSEGIVIDHLLPGRYQLQLNDIKRDFVVSDYDVSFSVQSGVTLYNVNYIVLNEETKEPFNGLRLDITKEGNTFGTFYTDSKGTAYTLCEEGTYDYLLHYAEKSGRNVISSDSNITILVPNPVLIEEISFNNCPCTSNGDTILLNLSFSPENATLKDVEWISNNQGLARVFSDGKFVANDFGNSGYVVITAAATDGSGITSDYTFYVGEDCGKRELNISFGEDHLSEYAINSDSLILNAEVPDKFSRFFIYQSSEDSSTWINVAGPTKDKQVKISAADYIAKSSFFRVVSSYNSSETIELASSGNSSCGGSLISNTAKTYSFSISEDNWTDAVCYSNNKVTLKIDKSNATEMPAGTQIRWFSKSNGSDYSLIENSIDKDSVLLSLSEKTFVKVAIINNDSELQIIEDSIDVDIPVEFSIKSSKDTVCVDDEVSLSVDVTKGSLGSISWEDGSSDSINVVQANEGLYKAMVTSALGICPSTSDSISLTIDLPADLSIKSNHSAICSSSLEPVELTVVNNNNVEASYSWFDGSKDTFIVVSPTETTNYFAVASSKYGKCKNDSANVTIYVSGPVSIVLDASEIDICQKGGDSITIKAQVIDGVSEEFLWWDGLTTVDSVRTIIPDSSLKVWATASNNVCGASTADTIDIKVATPADVDFFSPNSIFEYGSPIVLNANTTNKVYGPYKWIKVDSEGNETELSATDDSTFSFLPSEDAEYFVEIENGSCESIRSSLISTKLVDNIVIPTVFTPHEKNAENDDFMPGYKVTIYDRYGNIVCDSDNGWDGDYKGDVADAGVYVYVLTLKDGRTKKGTIEVYRK